MFPPELLHLLPYCTGEKQSCLLVLSEPRNEHSLPISISSIFLPKSQFCPMCHKTLFPCFLKMSLCVCGGGGHACVYAHPNVALPLCVYIYACMWNSKIDIQCLSLLHRGRVSPRIKNSPFQQVWLGSLLQRALCLWCAGTLSVSLCPLAFKKLLGN